MDVEQVQSRLRPVPPQQYLLAIADVVVFCCSKDIDQAEDFRNRIMEEMKETGHELTIYMNDELQHQGTELQTVAHICEISVQKWFYVTDNISDDQMMMLHKDEQLMEAVLQKKNSFVPVWSKEKDELNLPYGLSSYTGLHEQDPRLMKRLTKMFSLEKHYNDKQKLREQQQRNKAKWMQLEEIQNAEKERIQQEQHARRMAEMREEVKRSMPDRPIPQTDHDVIIQHACLQNQRHRPKMSPRGGSPKSPDSEIPDYLLASLNSARFSVSSPTNVYNITINNPQTVNIGESNREVISVDAAAVSESVIKNIQTDADNPNMNLMETDQPPMSTPVQESHGQQRDSSGSSYEMIPPPSEEEGTE